MEKHADYVQLLVTGAIIMGAAEFFYLALKNRGRKAGDETIGSRIKPAASGLFLKPKSMDESREYPAVAVLLIVVTGAVWLVPFMVCANGITSAGRQAIAFTVCAAGLSVMYAWKKLRLNKNGS